MGFGERKLAREIVSSIPIVHPRTPSHPEGKEGGEVKRDREGTNRKGRADKVPLGGNTSERTMVLPDCHIVRALSVQLEANILSQPPFEYTFPKAIQRNCKLLF